MGSTRRTIKSVNSRKPGREAFLTLHGRPRAPARPKVAAFSRDQQSRVWCAMTDRGKCPKVRRDQTLSRAGLPGSFYSPETESACLPGGTQITITILTVFGPASSGPLESLARHTNQCMIRCRLVAGKPNKAGKTNFFPAFGNSDIFGAFSHDLPHLRIRYNRTNQPDSLGFAREDVGNEQENDPWGLVGGNFSTTFGGFLTRARSLGSHARRRIACCRTNRSAGLAAFTGPDCVYCRRLEGASSPRPERNC